MKKYLFVLVALCLTGCVPKRNYICIVSDTSGNVYVELKFEHVTKFRALNDAKRVLERLKKNAKINGSPSVIECTEEGRKPNE